MRLQNKNFTFKTATGDMPVSRLLTSNVVIDDKKTDILLSQLFYDKRKEASGFIKGYSILEHANERGEIQINNRVYKLTFSGKDDDFVLQSVTDPTNVTWLDKTMSDSETLELEKLIEQSAPVVQQQEQPLKTETSETELTTRSHDETGAKLFTNEDYEIEKSMNPEFAEYNTVPESAMKLLVNESALPETDADTEEKLVLIELNGQKDFGIHIREEYKITLNSADKTFAFERISETIES